RQGLLWVFPYFSRAWCSRAAFGIIESQPGVLGLIFSERSSEAYWRTSSWSVARRSWECSRSPYMEHRSSQLEFLLYQDGASPKILPTRSESVRAFLPPP